MENIVDALKIAASVLVFVIAIGTSFTVFGKAKQSADAIISSRDKQAYLEQASLSGGILYTSSEDIKDETAEEKFGVTINGDRIVDISDVISTINRYSVEQYAVTIIKKENNGKGTVLARFDSITESQIINNWDIYGNTGKENYANYIKDRIETNYIKVDNIYFQNNDFGILYKFNDGKHGQNWYGNKNETNGINKRIEVDIYGGNYSNNGKIYEGKKLIDELKGKQIIEVIKEIDNSYYLKDGDDITELLQQYEMPTIEIIYIVQ